MSVSIKLSRTGAKNSAYYRIVAQTTKSARDGKNLEILGSYNPRSKSFELNKELFEKWIKNGALVTEGVNKILKNNK